MNKVRFGLVIVGLLLLATSCGESGSPPGTAGAGSGGSGGNAGSGGEGGGGSGGGAECTDGDVASCYSADAATMGVGECRSGSTTCRAGRWSGCEGEVIPAGIDDPCNLRDDDCDGVAAVDPGVCIKSFIQLKNPIDEVDFVGSVMAMVDGGPQHGDLQQFVPGSPRFGDLSWSRRRDDPLPAIFDLGGTSRNARVIVSQKVDGASQLSVNMEGTTGPSVLEGQVDGIISLPPPLPPFVSTDEPVLYRAGGVRLPIPRPTEGLTADSRGYIWTGSSPSLRIEPRSVTWEEVPHTGAGRPCAHGDEVWFAGDPVHAVSVDPPFTERIIEGFAAEVVEGSMGHILALAGGAVYEIDRATLERTPLPLPDGAGPASALASDGQGRFVVTFGPEADNLVFYDVRTRLWSTFNLPEHLHFTADPNLLDGTEDLPPYGIRTIDVELDRALISMDWSGETPGKSRIVTYVHLADSLADLASSRTVCSFEKPPADVRECASGKGFARIEFLLIPDGDNHPRLDEAYWYGAP